MATYGLFTHNQLRQEVHHTTLPLIRGQCPSYKTATFWLRAFADVIQQYAVYADLPPHQALIVLHLGVEDRLNRVLLSDLYRRSGFSRRLSTQLTNHGLGSLITNPVEFPRRGSADLDKQDLLSKAILNSNLSHTSI